MQSDLTHQAQHPPRRQVCVDEKRRFAHPLEKAVQDGSTSIRGGTGFNADLENYSLENSLKSFIFSVRVCGYFHGSLWFEET